MVGPSCFRVATVANEFHLKSAVDARNEYRLLPLANVVSPYREREGTLGLAPTNRFQKLGNVRAEGRKAISESFNMVALRKFRPW